MTVWRHNISWSKMKAALECPYRLQLIIDKAPASDVGPNYFQELGKIIQFTFEMYFNQGINTKGPHARTEAVIGRVTDKVLASDWFKARHIVYAPGTNEASLDKDIKEGIIEGRKTLLAAGLLDKPLRSEQKWISRFGGIGLFAMTDFTYSIDEKQVEVWDGKGHKYREGKWKADPRQVLHYALTITACGKTMTRGGLLYWRYGADGVEEINVSPQALKDYVDGPLEQVRPIFNKLRQGTERGEELEAKPSNDNCYSCFMKRRCKHSVFKADLSDVHENGEVSLDLQDDGIIDL